MQDECWIWAGQTDGQGYGSVSIYVGNGRSTTQRAHRLMYENLVGPIPKGLVIDHLCRNHTCVNPKHLEPVTSGENVLRGISSPAMNARKTHCLRGHPFDKKNTRITPVGGRKCRKCHYLHYRKSYLKVRGRLGAYVKGVS